MVEKTLWVFSSFIYHSSFIIFHYSLRIYAHPVVRSPMVGVRTTEDGRPYGTLNNRCRVGALLPPPPHHSPMVKRRREQSPRPTSIYFSIRPPQNCKITQQKLQNLQKFKIYVLTFPVDCGTINLNIVLMRRGVFAFAERGKIIGGNI